MLPWKATNIQMFSQNKKEKKDQWNQLQATKW